MNAAQRRIHQAALQLFSNKDAADVNISELAAAAQVARGTIYNNLDSVEALFDSVASQLCAEMNERVTAANIDEPDPARRLSFGLRYYIARAREEPDWARFCLRHALTTTSLAALWSGHPLRDVLAGIESGHFTLEATQAEAAVSAMAGAVLGGFVLVQANPDAALEIGSDLAELTLRGLGVPAKDASETARAHRVELAALAA